MINQWERWFGLPGKSTTAKCAVSYGQKEGLFIIYIKLLTSIIIWKIL